MPHALFTYGTLMFPEVWRAVLGDILVGRDFVSIPAILPGYQIFRVKDALYPGIIAANSLTSGVRPLTSSSGSQPSAVSHQPLDSPSGTPPSALSSPPHSPTSDLRLLTSVPGLLYLDLDEEPLARLDAFEGSEYIRHSVTVTCDDGRELAADAYIIPPENSHLLTNEIWTAEDFLAQGHLAEFISRYSGFNRLADS